MTVASISVNAGTIRLRDLTSANRCRVKKLIGSNAAGAKIILDQIVQDELRKQTGTDRRVSGHKKEVTSRRTTRQQHCRN